MGLRIGRSLNWHSVKDVSRGRGGENRQLCVKCVGKQEWGGNGGKANKKAAFVKSLKVGKETNASVDFPLWVRGPSKVSRLILAQEWETH